MTTTERWDAAMVGNEDPLELENEPIHNPIESLLRRSPRQRQRLADLQPILQAQDERRRELIAHIRDHRETCADCRGAVAVWFRVRGEDAVGQVLAPLCEQCLMRANEESRGGNEGRRDRASG